MGSVLRVAASQSYTKVPCYKKCDPDAFLADLNVVPWHTMEVFTSVEISNKLVETIAISTGIVASYMVEQYSLLENTNYEFIIDSL